MQKYHRSSVSMINFSTGQPRDVPRISRDFTTNGNTKPTTTEPNANINFHSIVNLMFSSFEFQQIAIKYCRSNVILINIIFKRLLLFRNNIFNIRGLGGYRCNMKAFKNQWLNSFREKLVNLWAGLHVRRS